MKEMVGGCCVCSDERGWPDNPLVYCDGNGCTVAVHQACYGIVTVPTGPWFCRKCESPETKNKVRCELCPSKSGALKRSDTGGWAHVVCALYIPEVRFGNVTSMEPIVLRLIPPERYNKTCYICQDLGKTHRANAGACMQCNKSGCKQQFHVTCAQGLGLLCEEAGNYLDNVKYCGYCQHHYSKLPGRKSSHTTNTVVSGKSTPNASKTPNQNQIMAEMSQDITESGPVTRKHKASEKNKKKPSPSRRGSSAGDGGSSSKTSTPAPSPQHTTETAAAQPKASGSSTPAVPPKVTPPAASPSANKPVEPVGVISSVAQAVASVSTITTNPTSAPVPASVVQVPTSKPTYQESVITNTDLVETKQTKKRKAIAAANNMNAPVDYTNNSTPPVGAGEGTSQPGGVWEATHVPPDVPLENVDKIIKKAKTEGLEAIPVPTSHFASVSPAPPPPPPPPAHSPASNPSPRHLPSPMPGPSGMNQVSNIRSPSNPQGGKGDREGPASLLVSVPLPSTSHGLNLTAHSQVQNEMPGPSPHIFHQPQKQVSTPMDTGMTGHSPHAMPGRSWGGLNVAYELQDPNKPGMSGMPGPSKQPDMGPVNMAPMPPTTVRTKKRAAMATSVVAMANTASAIQTMTTQTLASVRRQPQPTPPPIYSETIKDSPPSSPSSERPLKPKMESKTFMYPRIGASCTAPHMLGNELNPESGAAACLQEQLTAELAAHAAGSAGGDTLIPPPLINKAAPGGSISSGRSSSAQSLDQLLERQWEQGSQFLMEQAQHFDIASLLSCLHQLRTENVRLEEHVGSLLQRRDHLLAVNARLAIPLTTEMVLGERCTNSSDVPLRSDDWPARAEPVHARKWPADDAGAAAAAASARRRDYHLGPPTPAYNA
ncbi:protein AF-10-like isoform X12 [Spodoptera litura]|uniref:Protein AF-10-like isoform X12 n=1 Tax=Spodoptera litura TaxID=69820 RepID=A0A9J7IY95_SPOLT|nr:protein AF-10-like isoform X12 [Spodoptera litura]